MNITWNCCRVCLLTDDTMKSIQEIDEQDHFSISEKLAECGGISIKLNTIFPELICFKCRVNLDIAYKFRQECQKSDNFLRSFVGDEVKFRNLFKSPDDFNTVANDEFQIKAEMLDENCILLTTEKINDLLLKDQNTTKSKNEGCLINLGSPQRSIHLPEYEEYIQNDHSERSYISEHTDEIAVVLDHKTNKYKLKKQNRKIRPSRKVTDGKTGETNKMKANNIPKAKLRKSSNSLLKTIDRTKTSKKGDIHMCEICGNIYKKKYTLRSHMRRHQNEKPFSCEVCEKPFASNSELGRHMRIHTGLKPYECKFCGRKFSDFSTCTKHQRTHTNERPFKCKECGKGFNYSHVLKGHMLTHTGEKAYRCEPCGKTFAKKHHLTQHFASIIHQKALTT